MKRTVAAAKRAIVAYVPEHILAYVKRVAPWAFVDEKQEDKPRKKR